MSQKKIKHAPYNETFHSGRLTTTVTDWWISVEAVEARWRVTPIWELGRTEAHYIKRRDDVATNIFSCVRSQCLYPYLAGQDSLLGWLYRRDLS